MPADFKTAETKTIHLVLERLRSMSQQSILAGWRYHLGDPPLDHGTNSRIWPAWESVPQTVTESGDLRFNSKGQLVWDKGQQVLWLGQTIPMPVSLNNYPVDGLTLRLGLTWWADQAQVYLNGNLLQAGDLFDANPRMLLTRAVAPGQELDLSMRLVSPAHDQGALVRAQLFWEAQTSPPATPEPGFIADELTCLVTYLDQFQPEKLAQVAVALSKIAWHLLPNRAAFDQSLADVRQSLQPLTLDWQQHQIGLTGHAHLDLAWLWPVPETWQVAENTFESVLALQADFPDLIFCHSSPALYAWLETHRPALFQKIQTQVAAGKWEIVAGMWVEPELNLIQGESLVRQVLYGQRYVQSRFGQICSVAWLPDSFGFCWQLPQILRQGGVDYFVTQKLAWNDTTRFPHGAFYWQSPDGSQIFSYMSAPIGEGIDPVKMATYATEWQTSTGSTQSLWLPGVGDHGGGPTRDMLELAQRWQTSDFLPSLKFTSVIDYLRELQVRLHLPPGPLEAPRLMPVWADELYLEFHRGCYTTHAEQKLANRRNEVLLFTAELFASLATLVTQQPYPHAELEQLWKQVLFNQFHDILPGSSIPEVFTEANQVWAAVAKGGEQILSQALACLAAAITLPPPPSPGAVPVVVFNALNWQRSGFVTLTLPISGTQSWRVLELNGQAGPAQVVGDQVMFRIRTIPATGYCLVWLIPTPALPNRAPALPHPGLSGFVLENEFLRVILDPMTGNLNSVFDKQQGWQVLQGQGNLLQFFQDAGQYWDAWNIDPDYKSHPLPSAKLQSLRWLEVGPLEQQIEVVYRFQSSKFILVYCLAVDSPILKITVTVDWQERHVLVKAAFPVNLTANFATYEMPCGAIERPTLPNHQSLDLHQVAKWEVPAQFWADLSGIEQQTGEARGVSLLNDCKYGYDASPSQIRLTLLRGTTWPDPEADLGIHTFTYCLYPHSGDWRAAQTVHHGYELNHPLQAVVLSDRPKASASLPPSQSFFQFGSDNLILMAFKPAEPPIEGTAPLNWPQTWIVRGYECHGQAAQLQWQSANLPLSPRQAVDLLEQPLSKQIQSEASASLDLVTPWRIVSWQME